MTDHTRDDFKRWGQMTNPKPGSMASPWRKGPTCPGHKAKMSYLRYKKAGRKLAEPALSKETDGESK